MFRLNVFLFLFGLIIIFVMLVDRFFLFSVFVALARRNIHPLLFSYFPRPFANVE